MGKATTQIANVLVLAIALVTAVAPVQLAPSLRAQSQAPTKGMDPELLAKANAGDANAQYLVARAYMKGVDVPRDLAEAARWCRKAAEGGNPPAMATLGEMYKYGLGGLAEADVEAVRWYRKAAEAGDASGMFRLGEMYMAGRGGLTEDKAQAAMWYRKAAQLGDTDAQRALAQPAQAQANMVCMGRKDITSQMSPLELLADLGSCLDQERYDEGLFLYTVAATYGWFDSLRLNNAKARYIVAVLLPTELLGSLDKTKLAAFQDRVKQLSMNDTLRAKYCLDLKSMSPPDYFPAYLVSHGNPAPANAVGGAQTDSNAGDTPLVSPFDAAQGWNQSVDGFLHCQNAASH